MYDLRLYDAVGPTLDTSNFKPASVTGADKLGHRVVYALMTPVGTVPGMPAFGSHFSTLVQGFRSEHDIYVAFATTKGDVVSSVRSSEADSEPDSEKLSDVRVSSVSFTGDLVTIYLDVVSVDGSKPTEAPFIQIET